MISRPTEEEIVRMRDLMDEYFSSGHRAIDAKLWDDGDVHLTAYRTIDTNPEIRDRLLTERLKYS